MTALFEIVALVETFMGEYRTEDGRCLWDALVDSAREMNGVGCDGMLLRHAEEYTDKILSEMDVHQLRRIWPETENGALSSAQGLDCPDRWQMIRDIGIDVTQRIAETVCQEAGESRNDRTSS